MPVSERKALPYMQPGRADVIGAGALVLDRVLRRTRVDGAAHLGPRHPRRHRLVPGLTTPRPEWQPWTDGLQTTRPSSCRTRSPGDRSAHPCHPAPAGPTIPPTRGRRCAHRRGGGGARLRRLPGRPRRPASASAAPASGWCGWREEVASTKRASFAGEPYWGRPIAGWGARHPAGARRRAGARGERREPDRADLHRRPLGRLALRRRCTGSAWRGRRRPSTPATARSSSTPGWSRRCGAPHRRTSRVSGSATPALRGCGASSSWCCRRCVWWSAWAPSAGRPRSAPCRTSASPSRGRGPGSGTAPRCVLDGAAAGATRHGARLLPPQPAEHVHRQAHRGRCWTGSWLRARSLADSAP